jgi:hypothetical protein
VIFADQTIAFGVGVASSALVALMGFPSVRQSIEARQRKRNVRQLVAFWGAESASWTIVCGCEDASVEEEPEPRVGYAEAYSIAEIKRVLQTIHGDRTIAIHLSLLKERERIPRELFRDNVVVTGGVRSLEQFGVLCRLLRLPFQSTDDALYDRTFGRLEDDRIGSPIFASQVDKDEQRVLRDFGLIARIRNPENGKLIVLFDGNYAAGLLAAVLVATSNVRLSESQFAGAASKGAGDLELAVEVDSIIENMITLPEPEIRTVSAWVPLAIDRRSLSNALLAISRRTFRFADL